MKSLLGLLVVAVICVVGYWVFLRQAASTPEGAGTPQQTIDVVGVKNDLIAIAQAERAYQAEHGSYVSLPDLVASGSLTGAKSGRGGFTYDVETSPTDFRAIAHCSATPEQTCTSYFINSSMEVQPLP